MLPSAAAVSPPSVCQSFAPTPAIGHASSLREATSSAAVGGPANDDIAFRVSSLTAVSDRGARGVRSSTGTAPADRAGFQLDAGTISKPASKRPEATPGHSTQSATAPSKRAGQTGRAARTSAVAKGAAGRSGRLALPDHKPPLEAPAPPEQHAAAELRGGGKRKRAPSPAAARKGKQGRAAAAHVAEPAQKRSRAAEKAKPTKQGKTKAGQRGARAAAVDTQTAASTAKRQAPGLSDVPASAAPAAEQPRRAAHVSAKPAAAAKAKAKARLRGTASEQTAVADDAAQIATVPAPADARVAAVDAAPKAPETAPSEPVPAAAAAEAPAESPRKRGRVPSKRIAALQGSPGPEDEPAGHKRPADPGSDDAPLEGAPSSPRGAVKFRAKRSKRQQLDDEVVKEKYMADLKQYVEERGMWHGPC